MPRIFFAVAIPDHLREMLADLQSRVPGGNDAVKRVERENLHITLQFVGNVDEQQLAQILAGAQRAAQTAQPFTLEIGGAGVFPNPKHPRVIWAGVTQGRKELTTLAKILGDSIGIQPDNAYSPHLTLGRVREGRQLPLANFLRNEAGFTAGPMTVNHFTCMASTLTSQGAAYRSVKDFWLT